MKHRSLLKKLTAVTAAAMIAVTATASSFTALAGDPIERIAGQNRHKT
ncbi:MAG: hypothetical protein IKH90_04720 [Ruminococcus sp.]|nr:hypothetical protein [Ruminococcus sp.]MBR7007915.1 hypothetical protein [Ruminococcus sp.]